MTLTAAIPEFAISSPAGPVENSSWLHEANENYIWSETIPMNHRGGGPAWAKSSFKMGTEDTPVNQNDSHVVPRSAYGPPTMVSPCISTTRRAPAAATTAYPILMLECTPSMLSVDNCDESDDLTPNQTTSCVIAASSRTVSNCTEVPYEGQGLHESPSCSTLFSDGVYWNKQKQSTSNQNSSTNIMGDYLQQSEQDETAQSPGSNQNQNTNNDDLEFPIDSQESLDPVFLHRGSSSPESPHAATKTPSAQDGLFAAAASSDQHPDNLSGDLENSGPDFIQPNPRSASLAELLSTGAESDPPDGQLPAARAPTPTLAPSNAQIDVSYAFHSSMLLARSNAQAPPTATIDFPNIDAEAENSGECDHFTRSYDPMLDVQSADAMQTHLNIGRTQTHPGHESDSTATHSNRDDEDDRKPAAIEIGGFQPTRVVALENRGEGDGMDYEELETHHSTETPDHQVPAAMPQSTRAYLPRKAREHGRHLLLDESSDTAEGYGSPLPPVRQLKTSPPSDTMEAAGAMTPTAAAEYSSQYRRGPSAEELESVKNERQKKALKTWYDRLEDLYAFRAQNGHVNVPQQYKGNHALGIWVNKQRMEHRAFLNEEKSSMTQKKIEELQAISFEWAKPKGKAAWELKYRELMHYRQLYGDCNVPTKLISNRALGRWVSTQRNQYKRRHEGQPNNLDEQKITLLEQLGFQWKLAQVPRREQSNRRRRR